MITCANCSNEALYVYKLSENFKINYCQYHLPRILTKNNGSYLLPIEPEVVPEPVVKSSKKKSAPITEEAIAAEEPVIEEAAPVEETPSE